MYCSKCGKELQDGQKFCANCGAPAEGSASAPPPPPSSGATPPPPPPPPPPAGSYPPPSGGSSNAHTLDVVLKIFAGICAALFALSALGFLGNAIRMLGYFSFWTFLHVLLALLGGVAAVWMALVLVVLILKRRPETNDALVACLCAGAAVRLVLNILLTLINLVYGYFHFSFSFLWYAVVAGVVFLILYLMGEAPFLGKTGDEIKISVLEGLSMLLSNDTPAPGPRQDAPRQDAGPSSYYQPGPSGAQSGGQERQSYSYGYQDAPASGGGSYTYQAGPLKTDRSLVAYILLSIVTCGIYGYYFLYSMARDVNIACEGDGQKTPGLLPFILLSFITCGFYALYWYYCLANRLAANAPRYGLSFQENGTTILLWYLIGLLLCGIGPYVAMHFLIKNTNAICDAYNRRGH